MAAQETALLRGEMRHDEPLSLHTSWRVGGPARHFYRPADSGDLLLFLTTLAEEEPLLWLGLGSNLLVRDGGFDGTVIATRGCMEALDMRGETILRAEAGASCAAVARFASRQGLTGLEFLAGIPGTMGGALAMNAGAFGGETWKQVEMVETVDRYGVVRQRRPEEFEVGYRHVSGPVGEWFLAVLLTLDQGDSTSAQQRVRDLLAERAEKQPIGLPSCGSVFRNPPGDYAARLIEVAGLKGVAIGGARVSPKHANFIINEGDATASEIEQLIERVRQEVLADSGIELQTEVHIVGMAESGR
ncbi:MAG: UDP-N-acetylmuramate dehydrogenase [Sedimenticola sp.]